MRYNPTVLRRVLRYATRRDVRRQPLRLFARRARFELARRRGGEAVSRDRVARFGDGLQIGIRFDDKIERAIYLYGVYENLSTVAFLSLVQKGGTVVDAGAHVGHYTLLAAERVGPSGRVIAFEPDPRNRVRLERNVERNALDHVEVLPFAVFDREATLPFVTAPDGNTGLGSLAPEAAAAAATVRTVRIDDVLEQRGIERVDVVKLDVEGFEAPALEGAAQLLERSRPAVLFEVNRLDGEHGMVTAPAIDALRRHGYRVYAIEARGGRSGFGLMELEPGADPRPYAERWYSLNLVALHPGGVHKTLR